MGQDETGTLNRLMTLRKELVQPQIAAHKGRIVKLMGDGLLAEFPSVVEAVECAVDIQRGLSTREAELPEGDRVMLRIGVNLGDVIVEGADLYGDGVNVAARLEALSEPGGVCISGTVFDHVEGKVDLDFADLGEQRVKNIEQPVRVYRVVLGREQESAPSGTAADGASPALPALPSIAVLPFTNMSQDPEQEFFSDGISEDIITELSRSKFLFVVARNSSFQFRGESVDIRRAGEQLGVSYVLEGSVRKAGERIRITAQLIDSTTSDHLWAERYDGTTDDIFELQDDVSHSIVTTLVGRLDDAHAQRLARQPTKDFSAYEHALRGQKWMQKYSLQDYAKARKCFEAAIACDPSFARAHAQLGLVGFYEWNGASSDSPLLKQALQSCEAGLELDPHESRCHLAAGVVYLFHGAHEKADYHLARAAELNPNDELIMLEQGRNCMYNGEPLKGAELVRLAMRRNPFFPNWYWNVLGRCLHTAQQFGEALAAFERISTPQFFNHAYLAACRAALGEQDKARQHAAKALELKPDFTLSDFANQLPYRNEADRESFLDSFRLAGLPD